MDKESEDSGSESESEDELRELTGLPEYRGIAVIIGNTYKQKDIQSAKGCKQLSPLNGPDRDTEMMKEAFDYLRFLTMVKHDLSHDKTKAFLKLLAQYRYPKSCKRFVFTFSGHGGDGFICCDDGKTMDINEIVAMFSPTKSDNNSLAGVPRLFFFDACRGESIDQGVVARGGEGDWRSRIPSTGDVLVAFATTTGHKAYEQFGGGLWTSVLAKKLVTSLNSIYDILTEVNEELIERIRTMPAAPSFQQPELLGRLNGIISLLKESGQRPKQMEQEAPIFLKFLVDPVISARPSPGNDLSKNSKNKLQELCQSMKSPFPKYQKQISENGFVVVTVSIMIEGREIHCSYTSEQALSTKKHIKQYEEIAAEKALTELNRIRVPILPPQNTKSSDEPSGKPVQPSAKTSELQEAPSCPGFGSPGKKAKSQLNELFQKYKINAKYDSTDDVTDGNIHNFTATLTYSVHGRKCRYESRGVFGRKQDAEEDTAQQALCEIEQQLKQSGGVSCKQLLKERYCDERQLPTPQYTTEITSGGFVSTVNVPQYKPVTGPVGNSKKEAEQLAAMEALRQLKIN